MSTNIGSFFQVSLGTLLCGLHTFEWRTAARGRGPAAADPWVLLTTATPSLHPGTTDSETQRVGPGLFRGVLHGALLHTSWGEAL